MELDRRHFIKIAGLIGLGIAAKPVIDVLSPAEAANELKSAGMSAGQRLAMVVDLKASKDEFRSAMEACHRVHNVPDIKNVQHEIKWIWTTSYEGAFAEQGHEFVEEYLKHLPVPVRCYEEAVCCSAFSTET